MYHVYHHWRDCADDFLSDAMLAWAGDLGLPYIAARMKELRRTTSFADRMVGFLRLAEYFDDDEISALTQELARWEARREWEQLKDRADTFLAKNDPRKAIPLYRRALEYDENAPLLNNLAVAYMRLGGHAEGLRLLARARVLEPADDTLALHYAEAAILCGQFDRANKALEKATDPAHTAYLNGLMAFEHGEYPAALTHFDAALAHDPAPLYACKMADTYLRTRRFDDALAALERVAARDAEFFSKQAEVYTASGNVPAAIRAVRQALELGESVKLWTQLAAYYRMDYDLERAAHAIARALTIDGESDTARMEDARIKKAAGRTREYQAALTEILRGFKERYRES